MRVLHVISALVVATAGCADPADAIDPVDGQEDHVCSGSRRSPALSDVELPGVWVIAPLANDHGPRPPGGYHDIAKFFPDLRGNRMGADPLTELSRTDEHIKFSVVDRKQMPRTMFATRVVGCDGDELEGEYAWCEAGGCKHGPARMLRISRFDTTDASGVRLLGNVPGYALDVRVVGRHAYVAMGGLRIIDVSNPAAMPVLATVPAERGEIVNDVQADVIDGRTYVFTSSSSQGVVIYDVSNPSNPARVASIPGSVHNTFLLGTTLYVVDQSGTSREGLRIFDVRDPRLPVFRGHYRDDRGAFLHDLYVAAGIAYLNYWDGGLVILDVSNPATPRPLSRFEYDFGLGDRMTSHASWLTTIEGRKVLVHGDESFDGKLRLIDVDDPGRPTLLGTFHLRSQVSTHNLIAVGSDVYLANFQDGFRKIDISDPSAPRLDAWFNTWNGDSFENNGWGLTEGAFGIDVGADGRIYVADSGLGLAVLAPDR